MKIAFIVPEFPSLSQTFVLNQITGLLDRGHDVEIFATSPANQTKLHRDVMKYGLLSRTTYLPEIPVGRLERTLKGAAHALLHFPKAPKTVLRSLNVVKFGKLASSFTLIFRSIPFLGKGPFDIVHCHFGPCGNVGVQCVLTGALTGKIVTTFHGFDLTSYLKKNGSRIYDTLFEHCALCLPISDHWKKKLIEMGCRQERTAVHHMGVDTECFNQSRENKQGDRTRVLSIARLVEKKGIRYGIEAVSKVVERHANIEYLIAGDGPLRPRLEQMIRQLKLENHVRLAGWMTQEEVTDLMVRSDILLAPSITGEDGDQEGIPVVLMEALAMGLPVVSTRHSGIPELVIDGKTGLLARERDSDALADRIMELIGSDRLVCELRKNGREYVRENFDIKKLNGDLEKIYHQLVSGYE